MPTIEELRILQALPLDLKVRRTKQRIREWVDHYGVDGVYISFSGGKDSTVLLHIVREMYPDIPAVFVDTGLEYPEIRNFVKTFDGVTWLRPAMTFREVILNYGYPFFGKEVSVKIAEANSYKQHKGVWGGLAYRQLCGEAGQTENGTNRYNFLRYKFMLDCPYPVSPKCCNVMKKDPLKKYVKQTGRVGITGQTAAESLIRTTQWLKSGCNAFDNKNPLSNPLSFWTEQDILHYIKQNNIAIASVYGEIVPKDAEIDGQLSFDIAEVPLKTSGVSRTGCMFCGYGAHLEKAGEGRYERMKETHPKQYEYIMKPIEEGGLGFKAVIDWINEHNDSPHKIRY